MVSAQSNRAILSLPFLPAASSTFSELGQPEITDASQVGSYIGAVRSVISFSFLVAERAHVSLQLVELHPSALSLVQSIKCQKQQ